MSLSPHSILGLRLALLNTWTWQSFARPTKMTNLDKMPFLYMASAYLVERTKPKTLVSLWPRSASLLFTKIFY